MALRCPGREPTSYIETALIPCPSCGTKVELFADEYRVRCRCGEHVTQEALPSCAQWCPEADRCFGTVGSAAQVAARLREAPDHEEQKRRFRELRALVEAALADCSQPDLKEEKPA